MSDSFTMPQMPHNGQSAQADNANLRTLLEEIQLDDVISLPSSPLQPEAKIAKANTDFGHTLAQRQARLNSAATTRGALTTAFELQSASDRVAELEGQLLDAEETICHLKAEKLAALRDVEKLSAARVKAVPGTESLHNQVVELEARLAEQTIERTQHMDTIHAQECALATLRVEVSETTRRYKALQQRHRGLRRLETAATVQTPRSRRSVVQSCNQSDKNDDTYAHELCVEETVVGRARAPADADTVTAKWHEVVIRHPTPHFDLQSPEVAYVLRAWTPNMKKWRSMRRWLLQVASTHGPLPRDFPMAVELPRLPPEVRDGFLALVLPLLRQQTQRDILAHCRQYNDGIHTDLRFRIVLRDD